MKVLVKKGVEKKNDRQKDIAVTMASYDSRTPNNVTLVYFLTDHLG